MQTLADFIESSPTAFHAVKSIGRLLDKKGFKALKTHEKWKITKGDKFYVESGGSLFAFIVPKSDPKQIKSLSAHTDSPALKLKPNPLFKRENLNLLAVEVYGAPLLSSWLNRDLRIAGKIVRDGSEELVDFKNNLVTIPQLAIHLDREVNEKGLQLNKQEHLNILTGEIDFLKGATGHDLFVVSAEKVSELSGGLLQGPRLDNLVSCLEIVEALPDSSSDNLIILNFYNHEEIGSMSPEGAESHRFEHFLERVILSLGFDRLQFLELISTGIAVSIDVAHAAHPNYLERHDPNHRIKLGGGIVMKWNASQKYATESSLSAYFPGSQHFVSKNEMPCGSTIGPIQAVRSGMSTIDMGCPILSMHSIREVIALSDHLKMIESLKKFLA